MQLVLSKGPILVTMVNSHRLMESEHQNNKSGQAPDRCKKCGLEGFCEFSLSQMAHQNERELGSAPGCQLAIPSSGSQFSLPLQFIESYTGSALRRVQTQAQRKLKGTVSMLMFHSQGACLMSSRELSQHFQNLHDNSKNNQFHLSRLFQGPSIPLLQNCSSSSILFLHCHCPGVQITGKS